MSEGQTSIAEIESDPGAEGDAGRRWIIPDQLPILDGIEIAAGLCPSQRTRGDYFDVIPLGDHSIALLIADASGDDSSTARVASAAKASFSVHCRRSAASIADVFRNVNADLRKDIAADRYLSVFMAIIDREAGTLRYGSAGHFRQCLYKACQGKIEFLSTGGMCMGLFENGGFEEKSCAVDINDKLIMFTDGLFPATDAREETSGQERLYGVLGNVGGLGVKSVFHRITGSHRAFCTGQASSDDSCLIVAGIKERSGFGEIHRRPAGLRTNAIIGETSNENKNDFFSFDITPMRVTLTLRADATATSGLTEEDVRIALYRHRIVKGIDGDAIRAMLAERTRGKRYVICTGEEPVNGYDARIIECVKIDPTLTPLVKNDGGVDLKVLDLMECIKPGVLIMKKIPATCGTPGISVFGDFVPAKPGEDLTLPAGENTEISGDGLRLLAKTGGYLYRSGDGIHVRQLFHVKGNVDYSTGNVDYEGDVLVSGNVVSGFSVKAGGSICIQGETEAAEIISKGDIEFRGGVFGSDKAKITCGGSIRGEFIQDAVISAAKNLVVRKHLLRLKAEIGGDVVVEDRKNGVIVGGVINCRGSVHSAELGNATQVATVISLPAKVAETVTAKITQAKKKRHDLSEMYACVKGQLQVKSQLLTKLRSQRTQEQKAQIEALLEKFYFIKQQLDQFDQAIAALESRALKETDYGKVYVYGAVHANTTLAFGTVENRFASATGPGTFYIDNKEIKMSPLERRTDA